MAGFRIRKYVDQTERGVLQAGFNTFLYYLIVPIQWIELQSWSAYKTLRLLISR